MADEGLQLRSIAWTRVFPFLRLFRTALPALQLARIVPAFLCVLVCYFAGRTLDFVWGERGAVRAIAHSVDVPAAPGAIHDEIEAYATSSPGAAAAWRTSWNAMAKEDKVQRGPFIGLLAYEQRCFAAAIGAVGAGRLGFGGSAFSATPSLLGSVGCAAAGVQWLVTQRPGYAIAYGLIHIIAFSLFGVAVCRHAAIQSARDENIGMTSAIAFGREKLIQAALAPTILLLALFGLGLALVLGGLVVGAISKLPFLGGVGYVLAGLLFGLALLIGAGLAFALAGLVTGSPLMLPTIAAEGSDAMDAISRSISYVLARPWHMAFYSIALLAYGALAFVFVRLCAVLVLKLTHAFTSIGMGGFGAWRSVNSDALNSVGRLDAMWRMPEWSQLTLLPSTGSMPFWGTFGNATLSGGESIGMWLIGVWVFSVVGLVGAFVVSFYFSACTEMYFLLRREVDATDWEDVFYEAAGDDLDAVADEPAAAGAPSPASTGTSLPVMSNPSATRSAG